MRIRRIRWGRFFVGLAILSLTLFLAIYMPTDSTTMGRGRNSDLAFLGLVTLFGEFAGRYFYFLPSILIGCAVLRDAFRSPALPENDSAPADPVDSLNPQKQFPLRFRSAVRRKKSRLSAMKRAQLQIKKHSSAYAKYKRAQTKP
jgi:hypothetical protein